MDPQDSSTDRALEIDAARLRGRRNGGLLIALGALAIVGSWWLIPQSIIATLTAADPAIGIVNVLVGVIALVAGISLIVLGIQVQKRATDAAHDALSGSGPTNPLFGNPGAPTPSGQSAFNLTGLTIH
jgi:predicted phage tail protein